MFVRSPARAAVNDLHRCYHIAAARRQVAVEVTGCRAVKLSVIRAITTQDDIWKYKNESATLARWMDVSIVQRKGRYP